MCCQHPIYYYAREITCFSTICPNLHFHNMEEHENQTQMDTHVSQRPLFNEIKPRFNGYSVILSMHSVKLKHPTTYNKGRDETWE